MRGADVTFVIITKNEAERIAGCLQSVPLGAPTLVYDAASSDATRAVALGLGADVVAAPWCGFVAARNAAAALVRTPWTFMLDADERIMPELADELAALRPPDDTVAYSVPRRNMFCGRWVRGSGWWPDRLMRLFRTGHARLTASSGHGDNALHEAWIPQGRAAELRSPILHESYRSIAEYWRKFARYTDLEAASRRRSVPAICGAWILVPPRAAWLLVGRGAVRDGWRGAFIASASALYPAVAQTKAWRRRTSPPVVK